MEKVIIVGASGFGRELLETIETMNVKSPIYEVEGFIDDNLSALDGFGIKYKVIGTIKDWKPIPGIKLVLAIAAPKTKENVVNFLKSKGAEFATIIAPTATVGARTTVGEGVIIFGNTGISVDVEIGNFVFFNSLCGIGHDVVIGDFTTFGPKVCISGQTKIGRCCNFGALSSTYPGITVGDYATVGMNSAALRKVRDNTTVIGVPARVL